MANDDTKAILSIIENQLSSISNRISLSYGSNRVKHMELCERSKCLSRPIVQFPKESNKLYTVMMVDPDAPSARHPTMAPWLHWIVHNISEDNLEGNDNCSYFGPAPPRGIHRYLTLVFVQKAGPLHGSNFEERSRFKFRNFVHDLNLQLKYGHMFMVDSKKPE